MDNNNIPISIFLDMSKAFDTIDHNILLAKLKHYGLDGIPLNLCKCYLTNRTQYVDINSTKSNILPITTGVPQGSILGPLLFIIYVNDLSNSSQVFDFISYADDTTLLSTLGNLNTTAQLNVELANVNEWLEINQLSLNKDKCKYMVFHMPQKRFIAPRPQINTTIIEKVNEFNFLGLILDTHLNWKKHSENISNKCSRAIGILNRLKHILPLSIKIILYNSLILPHISYCIMTWGFQHQRIDKLMKKGIRIITLSKYNSHTAPLFKMCNILKVKDILALKELKLYYQFLHNNLPHYLQNLNIVTNTSIHSHNTRSRNDIHIIGTRHNFAKRCLKYDLAITFNNTPKTVRDKLLTHSLHGFTRYAKNYIIQNYNDVCSIVNCYSCMHN